MEQNLNIRADLQAELQEVIQQYKDSESNYLKSKAMYDELANIITKTNLSKHTENTEETNPETMNSGPSKTSYSSRPRASKGKLTLHQSKSSSSTEYNSPFVELRHKIHQFENYMNLMKQAKEPPEKAEFLKMLHE